MKLRRYKMFKIGEKVKLDDGRIGRILSIGAERSAINPNQVFLCYKEGCEIVLESGDWTWELMSDIKKIESKNQTLNIKHIINGTTTIVILEDGRKGIAKLYPGDKFDEKTGFIIAYERARGMEGEEIKKISDYSNEELVDELKRRMEEEG
jgi:hypothetical protein